MVIVNVEIPEEIISKFGFWKNVSYEKLITKTIWKEYISPDLKFVDYEKMSDTHKKEYDKLDNIDKSKLLNI